MISRNYKRQINSSMSKQSAALERSESGLAFKKLSDNVAAGSRAMHLQEQRYAAEQQLDNVKNLYAELKSIDSNLSSVHSILQTIQERVLTGMSQDWGQDARDVIAKEIAEKREQLLQFANNQYAGHTLFGGTNNSEPPFTVSADGKLQFNGINVEDIFKFEGKYYYYERTLNDKGETRYTIDGGEYWSADGQTFTADLGTTTRTLTVNGKTYTSPAHDGVFVDENGNTVFTLVDPADPSQGYSQVTIDGVLYTKNGNYYYADGDDPTDPQGKVFESLNSNGFTFTEVVEDPDTPGTMIPKEDGQTVVFDTPAVEDIPDVATFKTNAAGTGYLQFSIGKETFSKGQDGFYYNSDRSKAFGSTDGGLTFFEVDPENPDLNAPIDGGAEYSFTLPVMTGSDDPKIVPNSGDTFADIGLGLKIRSSDMMADPRTAYQVSFSGLSIMGCAGISYDGDFPDPIVGANGTIVSGNLYDLLGQIQNALSPNFDKATLDDCFTQLVNLTDQVGMVRTDLGNRMEYLELTETRLDDDITNMTELETDLISSDPAEEAIKMKECEYVWLALMQLGSKVLPASLLDFMS